MWMIKGFRVQQQNTHAHTYNFDGRIFHIFGALNIFTWTWHCSSCNLPKCVEEPRQKWTEIIYIYWDQLARWEMTWIFHTSDVGFQATIYHFTDDY